MAKEVLTEKKWLYKAWRWPGKRSCEYSISFLQVNTWPLTLHILKLSLSDWEFQPGGKNAFKLWDRNMTGVFKGQQRGQCGRSLGNKREAIDDAFRKVIWSGSCAFLSLVMFYSAWFVEYWRIVSRGLT